MEHNEWQLYDDGYYDPVYPPNPAECISDDLNLSEFFPDPPNPSEFVPKALNASEFITHAPNPSEFIPNAPNPSEFVPDAPKPSESVPDALNLSEFTLDTLPEQQVQTAPPVNQVPSVTLLNVEDFRGFEKLEMKVRNQYPTAMKPTMMLKFAGLEEHSYYNIGFRVNEAPPCVKFTYNHKKNSWAICKANPVAPIQNQETNDLHGARAGYELMEHPRTVIVKLINSLEKVFANTVFVEPLRQYIPTIVLTNLRTNTTMYFPIPEAEFIVVTYYRNPNLREWKKGLM